ncbi:hypothetical protein DL1_11440 [Thioclava dalianensis]|uniref:Tail assembly chaperone n=1 Tax=Thioclava dalianensis TaxID=1185766 RepID=A0A074U1I4_9RHOB|nr:hypothetical protein [Thioclava dalianensis]KEP68532.1 hypothetical protein DL1_11440 [Thioclava dalianensis]SFN83855.1 hypothetical protein SAMN05216224_1179 [Thioclava dalianensis]
MQLDDILANAEDQDRGTWFDLRDPVLGEPTGIRFRMAGPDSATQARARVRLVDELADLADDEGRVSADAREKARINSLARCVLGWEIREGGEDLPFTHANVLRVLRSAQWVHEQVDSFAGARPAIKGVS